MSEEIKKLKINTRLIGITTGAAVYFGAITLPLIAAPSISMLVISAILPAAWHLISHKTISNNRPKNISTADSYFSLSDPITPEINRKFKILSLLNSILVMGAVKHGFLAFPLLSTLCTATIPMILIAGALTYVTSYYLHMANDTISTQTFWASAAAIIVLLASGAAQALVMATIAALSAIATAITAAIKLAIMAISYTTSLMLMTTASVILGTVSAVIGTATAVAGAVFSGILLSIKLLTAIITTVILASLAAIIAPAMIALAFISTEIGRDITKAAVDFSVTNVTRVYGFLRDAVSRINMPSDATGSPNQQPGPGLR